MKQYTTANSQADLECILALQKANLTVALSSDEIQSQGFVTVNHSYGLLKELNNLEKHIVAKDNGRVIGYLLAMTRGSRFDIPVLVPMFNVFDNIDYKGRKISEYNYLVVGQVCIDKAYRGQGILDKCYKAYKEHYSSRYDFAITEIAAANPRSISAHKRIGFKEVHSYSDPGKTEWVVVLWDWQSD